MKSNEPASGPDSLLVPSWGWAEWSLLLVLAAVQFTHIMDFMIVMPLGPKLQTDPAFMLNTFEFGMIVSVYNFSACLAGLVAAGWIDRFGRKVAMLSLYAGFALGTLFCAVAPNYPLLLLARVIAGAFGGIVGSMSMTIVGDRFHPSQRGTATGILMWGFSAASIAGVPVGLGLANLFGWWAPFAAVGFLSLVILAGAVVVLPPMQGHLRRGFGPRISTWAVVIDPTHVRAYVLVTALMMSSFMIAPFIATFLVKNLGQPENDLYLVYLTGGFATLVSLPLVGRLADRLGKLIVFQVSALAIIVPILVLVRLTDVSFAVCVVVTTLFMIFASGRMVPGMALITGCALPRYRGSFLSVNSSVQQAAAGLAAMLTGLLTRTGPDHSIIGFTQVGSIAAVFALASVVLGARLKPADETVAPLREERLITSEEGATATVALALLRARGRETPPLDTPLPAPAE